MAEKETERDRPISNRDQLTSQSRYKKSPYIKTVPALNEEWCITNSTGLIPFFFLMQKPLVLKFSLTCWLVLDRPADPGPLLSLNMRGWLLSRWDRAIILIVVYSCESTPEPRELTAAGCVWSEYEFSHGHLKTPDSKGTHEKYRQKYICITVTFNDVCSASLSL